MLYTCKRSCESTRSAIVEHQQRPDRASAPQAAELLRLTLQCFIARRFCPSSLSGCKACLLVLSFRSTARLSSELCCERAEGDIGLTTAHCLQSEPTFGELASGLQEHTAVRKRKHSAVADSTDGAVEHQTEGKPDKVSLKRAKAEKPADQEQSKARHKDGKHRPAEASSKKPVKRLRDVVEGTRRCLIYSCSLILRREAVLAALIDNSAQQAAQKSL